MKRQSTSQRLRSNQGSLFALALLLLSAAFVAHASSTVASNGTFTGKSDHITTGGVSILETSTGYAVVLESDFSLDGAPDPKIGFGNDGTFAPETLFTALENNTGMQIYEVPASIDPTKFDEVYIWCEKFSVPLGVATLK